MLENHPFVLVGIISLSCFILIANDLRKVKKEEEKQENENS